MRSSQRFSSGFFLVLALALNTPLHASDGVIGPGNCDESGFANVLNAVQVSGGGTITFNCGSAPSTIVFSIYHQISGAVTIDGNNLITFDGNNVSPFLQVFAAANATFRRLTFKRGVFGATHPLENLGTLLIDSCTVTQNISSDSAIGNFGTLTIRNSTLTGNAINSGASHSGAALRNSGGSVRIENSTFSSNASGAVGVFFGASNGGAIADESGGDLSIMASTFAGNGALDGGAIYVASGATATISGSTFSANGGVYGAAIETSGTLVKVHNSTFSGNHAADPEGGGDGGAILVLGAPSALVAYATITANTAAFGAGLYKDGAAAGTLLVGRSIVSANVGGNCDGVLVSNGYNLSDDAQCGSFVEIGDAQNANLPLMPFANYGGPTSTQPPAFGNVAIDRIPLAACLNPYDQRGGVRPTGAACDSGAIELNATIDRIFVDSFD